jgi:hypothetical protein
MVVKLFGFEPLQDLEHHYKWRHGVDVFLSSLVAVHFLQDSLTTRDLCELVACLEGTIQFRSPDEVTGKTATEDLFDRLVQVNLELELNMTEAAMELACQQAADLHNRLLGSFVSHDPQIFLDHTWSMLPEENTTLRRTYLYSLNDFYSAVMDMRNFMDSLEHMVLCSSFRGIPPTWEMEEFQRFFVRNHRLGITYLRCKLLGLGIVVAFATLTGGANVPKSLFFGDLQPKRSTMTTATDESNSSTTTKNSTISVGTEDSNDNDNTNSTTTAKATLSIPFAPKPANSRNQQRAATQVMEGAQSQVFCLGDGLPTLENIASDCQPQIYEILKEGRQLETAFDHRHAPISAFVYGTLGEARQNEALELCIYPMTEESSWSLLELLPLDLVKAAGREVANVAVARTHLVYNVMMLLGKRQKQREMGVWRDE